MLRNKIAGYNSYVHGTCTIMTHTIRTSFISFYGIDGVDHLTQTMHFYTLDAMKWLTGWWLVFTAVA